MNCIYCGHPYTYILKDGLRKCSKCKRKFSLKKIAKEQTLKSAFIEARTAKETSTNTGIHIATVLKYYRKFRRDIALYSDREYQRHIETVTGYDEYLYLPKSLKIEKNIDKLQHFLTLSYEKKVYNLMMPTLRRYGYDRSDTQERKLLLKYLQFNKVAKLTKAENTITLFWDYFEDFILQYKGVSGEQFIFYLKEAEWRFNYSREEQKKILFEDMI